MFRALVLLVFMTSLPVCAFADKLYETTVKGGKLVVYGGVHPRGGDLVFYYSWYLRVAGHKVSQGRGNVTLDIPNRGSSVNLTYNNGSTELRYRARQQADQRIKLDIDGRFTLNSDAKTSWYPLLSATIPLNGGPEQRNNRTPSRAVFHIQNGWLEDQNGDRPDVFLNIERGRIESTTILNGMALSMTNSWTIRVSLSACA